MRVLSTGIGSMPHRDAREALPVILKYVDIPFWPQLPKRTELENMYIQFSYGFPGLRIKGGRLIIKKDELREELKPEMEREQAQGLFEFLSLRPKAPFVKGQITGPVSLGLYITDGERPIIYDDDIMEMMTRFLRLRASWQEEMLSSISKPIIFIDEPYLPSLGSAFVAFPWERARELIEEVMGGLGGIKGIHCCTNMDWSLLLELPLDIISFDAYNYGEDFLLYRDEIKDFVKRGGMIAWGVVPNSEDALLREGEEEIRRKLESMLSRLEIDLEKVIITPSCGLSSLSERGSERVLSLLKKLKEKMGG